MSFINNIVREWAYQLGNGIPNINNDNDILVLQNILVEKGVPSDAIMELIHNLKYGVNEEDGEKKDTPKKEKDEDDSTGSTLGTEEDLESKGMEPEDFKLPVEKEEESEEEELDESVLGNTSELLTEAAFDVGNLSNVKYQPQWLDYIQNGKPFQLEPSGEVVLDKSNLKSKGFGDKTFLEILSGGTKEEISSFFRQGTRYQPILVGTDGKKYRLNDISKSTFTGQGGGAIPTDAASYEMGICVEYNKLKGMDTDSSMKTAEVDPKRYEKYEQHLTEVCSKVVKKLGNVGPYLRQTGGDRHSPASEWPSSDGTPKTDIFGGTDFRISVKKQGGSQLMSGKKDDAKGIFMAALAFYEEHSKSSVKKHLSALINSVERDFKAFNTDNEVGVVRKNALNSYIAWRTPQIAKQTKAKPANIEKHAKAEAIAVGITGASGKWNTWFIDGVKQLSEKDVMKWFDGYWKSQGTKELQDEVRELVTTAIDHKRLDSEIRTAFNDTEFKKWCIYEAASGNFKFSGNANLESTNDAIANKILVFDLKGGVKVKNIDASWASQYTSKVTSQVNFKSSGRSKYTALRLLQESNESQGILFEHDLNEILNEETQVLNEIVDISSEVLEEISLSGVISNIKSITKKLMTRIKDVINKFYTKVLKKVISKLKEYASAGIETFMDYLGIDIEGHSDVSINF